MLHFTASRPLFSAAMDSRSRWLVGWSSMSTLAPESIILESIQRTVSPPERDGNKDARQRTEEQFEAAREQQFTLDDHREREYQSEEGTRSSDLLPKTAFHKRFVLGVVS